MESKRFEGRVLRAEQITNGESVWGASERRERPTSASTRARVVSIAGIEVLMLSSAIPIQAVAPYLFAPRSARCRQSSVCLTGAVRKRMESSQISASERYLSDIRYFGGSP